jgi:hypothetical protein
MRNLRLSLLAVVATLWGVGCAAHESVATRPPPCPGAAWVEGHYGPSGKWHPAHWVCPAPLAAPVPVVPTPVAAPSAADAFR